MDGRMDLLLGNRVYLNNGPLPRTINCTILMKELGECNTNISTRLDPGVDFAEGVALADENWKKNARR